MRTQKAGHMMCWEETMPLRPPIWPEDSHRKQDFGPLRNQLPISWAECVRVLLSEIAGLRRVNAAHLKGGRATALAVYCRLALSISAFCSGLGLTLVSPSKGMSTMMTKAS